MIHCRTILTGRGIRFSLINSRNNDNNKSHERFFLLRVCIQNDDVFKLIDRHNNNENYDDESHAADDAAIGAAAHLSEEEIRMVEHEKEMALYRRVKDLEIVSCWSLFVTCLADYALMDPRSNVYVIDDSFESIYKNSSTSNIPLLRCKTHLTLENIPVSVQGCCTIASALKVKHDGIEQDDNTINLRRLDFENCSFESKVALQILVEDGLKINDTVSTLNLINCRLRDDELKLILSSLPSTVEALDVSQNYCRSDGMAIISSVLLNDKNNEVVVPRLKRLNLTNQHPGELGGETLDLTLLGLSLPSNTTLIDLDLGFNMLTFHDIHNLVGALAHNTTLKKLNLMNNRLNDCAIMYIGKHLPKINLRSLNVSANKFGDDGADSLMKGLEKNYTLRDLSMPRGFSASERIDFLLALNRGGRAMVSHIQTLNDQCNPMKNDDDDRDDMRYKEDVKKNKTQAHPPMGLWSLVFDRANRVKEHSPIVKASVMFYLVSQGLAPSKITERGDRRQVVLALPRQSSRESCLQWERQVN